MVRKKSGTRRQSLKDKYKIDKKCKEHKKKLRKQARDAGPGKKPKADPGIPNLWPFKDKILAKLARDKEAEADQKLKQLQHRKAFLNRLKKAQAITEDDTKEETLKTVEEKSYAKRRWYFKEMKKVIAMSDVILEVVDARDPMGCRCLEIERRVQEMAAMGKNKRLVIVMNKIDLVPQEVATAWVKRLRKEFPTVAFKASTQQQGARLSQSTATLAQASEGVLNSAKSVGASVLMQLLKNYCRNHDIKTAITVGIIGYPNVGKSSIINSLKRSRAAGVGATPGFTKEINAIRIDKYINMLDSPGVLFSPECTQTDLVLRNCIKLEDCEDPVEAVQSIAERCPKEQLMQIYKIADYGRPEEFISHVAHKRGKLKKGGIPNLIAAARTILNDWTTGEIPYYTLPPEAPADSHDSKVIVEGWSKEFDLDSLEDMHAREISTAAPKASSYMAMAASTPLKMSAGNMDGDDSDEEDGEDGMDEGDDAGMDDEEDGKEDGEAPQIRVAEKKSKEAAVKPQVNPLSAADQVNKKKKASMKKASKQKKKEEGDNMGDDYNFASDF